MSKLLTFRKWLTVEEAARYLSQIREESVTEAEVLRHALDGSLTLSVDFVIDAEAHIGQLVPGEEVVAYEIRDSDSEVISNGTVSQTPGVIFRGKPEIVKIGGVWDLCLFGGGRLEAERKYQRLTGGSPIELCSDNNDVIVRDHEDPNCYALLLERRQVVLDSDPLARLEGKLKARTGRSDMAGLGEDPELVNEWMELVKEGYREPEAILPAVKLPDNARLVVRTDVLMGFQQSILDENRPAPHISDKLADRSPGDALLLPYMTTALEAVIKVMRENWTDYDPKRLPKQINIAREIDAALGWGKKGDPNHEPSRDAKAIAKIIKPDNIEKRE